MQPWLHANRRNCARKNERKRTDSIDRKRTPSPRVGKISQPSGLAMEVERAEQFVLHRVLPAAHPVRSSEYTYMEIQTHFFHEINVSSPRSFRRGVPASCCHRTNRRQQRPSGRSSFSLPRIILSCHSRDQDIYWWTSHGRTGPPSKISILPRCLRTAFQRELSAGRIRSSLLPTYKREDLLSVLNTCWQIELVASNVGERL